MAKPAFGKPVAKPAYGKSVAKRAYGKEDKQVRREVLLAAARRLFASGSGDLPAVAEIAVAAGLAKGTVYLYFATKEAIFAALLLEGWSAVLREVDAVFTANSPRPDKIAEFLNRSVASLVANRDLLRLDALGHGVVERNLEPETLHIFKSASAERLLESAAIMETALHLPPGRGVQLLMRTYALTRGLWQALESDADKPNATRTLLPQTDFKQELREALAEYWRGALADTPGFEL